MTAPAAERPLAAAKANVASRTPNVDLARTNVARSSLVLGCLRMYFWFSGELGAHPAPNAMLEYPSSTRPVTMAAAAMAALALRERRRRRREQAERAARTRQRSKIRWSHAALAVAAALAALMAAPAFAHVVACDDFYVRSAAAQAPPLLQRRHPNNILNDPLTDPLFRPSSTRTNPIHAHRRATLAPPTVRASTRPPRALVWRATARPYPQAAPLLLPTAGWTWATCQPLACAAARAAWA